MDAVPDCRLVLLNAREYADIRKHGRDQLGHKGNIALIRLGFGGVWKGRALLLDRRIPQGVLYALQGSNVTQIKVIR